MLCQECGQDFRGRKCQCGWGLPMTAGHGGQTLRLTACDVPGCGRIVSAGDAVKHGAQGLRLLVRCRFHRDPRYQDPPQAPTMPVLADHSPFVSFVEIRADFDRIRSASGRALRAYWQEQEITVRPLALASSERTSLETSMRRWADKFFPPVP